MTTRNTLSTLPDLSSICHLKSPQQTTTMTYRKYWTDSKRILAVAFVLGAVAERSLGLGGGVRVALPLGQRSLMDGWLWHIARCYGWQQGSGDGVGRIVRDRD